MARRSAAKAPTRVESYEHTQSERVNNPLAGLVTPGNDPETGEKQTYSYDPHLSPQLQWAGKSEHTSFSVPTVSLHVHERIDPSTIIHAARAKNGNKQPSLFEKERNKPLREVVDFYRHARSWSNRLVAGDSLLVMNSLLQKEGMEGKVQMAFMDPPYGIRYGSNFQPFVDKREVKDKDEDLTSEPEQIQAFRDTWELGIHSYLTYLRDRLLLTRELLAESGSMFVQIGEENLHLVRLIMDEVFGQENFVRLITFAKTGSMVGGVLGRTSDYLLWYAKNATQLKSRPLYTEKLPDDFYSNVEEPDGTVRKITKAEQIDPSLLPEGSRVFRLVSLELDGASGVDTPFEFEGETFRPNANGHWKLSYPDGMNALKNSGRIVKDGEKNKKLRWKHYISDHPLKVLSQVWDDTAGLNPDQRYVVETRTKVLERCLLMSTDPGDLVFDPTCGSGTTAFVSEQWGRRWITCDTSRVALTLARQRLMTAVFDYYSLARPKERVGGGFKYETAPHVTLKSIAENANIKEGMSTEEIEAAIARDADQSALYDRPLNDEKKKRVSGPFTVEAVPAPSVIPLDENDQRANTGADTSIARSGETLRQSVWRDELLRSGVRGKGGQYIRFARLEPLAGCRCLHADGETRLESEELREQGKKKPKQRVTSASQRAVVCFGPQYAPMERRQVELALQEAGNLKPTPELIIFAAFQFDSEAAKDIDETIWPGVTLIKVQMNNDLLTLDLKKKISCNEPFWLVGQPDVTVEHIRKGPRIGQWQVIVQGYDYYSIMSGEVDSGGNEQIALWMLDTDYDGKCFFPHQVFFPMKGDKGGWPKLGKALGANVDLGMVGACNGVVSLPFESGKHERIAVKLVDNRGIESLRVIDIKY